MEFTTYKGYAISVDDNGRFWATVYKQGILRDTFGALKIAIDERIKDAVLEKVKAVELPVLITDREKLKISRAVIVGLKRSNGAFIFQDKSITDYDDVIADTPENLKFLRAHFTVLKNYHNGECKLQNIKIRAHYACTRISVEEYAEAIEYLKSRHAESAKKD